MPFHRVHSADKAACYLITSVLLHRASQYIYTVSSYLHVCCQLYNDRPTTWKTLGDTLLTHFLPTFTVASALCWMSRWCFNLDVWLPAVFSLCYRACILLHLLMHFHVLPCTRSSRHGDQLNMYARLAKHGFSMCDGIKTSEVKTRCNCCVMCTWWNRPTCHRGIYF